MLKYILIILLFLNFSQKINGEYHYRIDHLNDHASLYYNHVGNAQISNSHFTLLTHFNMSHLETRYSQLTTFFVKSQNMCARQETNSAINHMIHFCESSLTLIHSQLSRIYTKMQTLNQLTGHNANDTVRNKRGLINAGSYVIHWLFGTPDAEDAQYYETSIHTLVKDNRNIQLLMQQQIAITTNAIQNFNASIQALKINEIRLNENIQLFNTFSQEVSSAINEFRLQQVITEQISLLTHLTNDLDQHCELMTAVITLAKHNILHPHIITPIELLEELNNIILQNGQKLPITLSRANIHRYFEINTLKVVYINGIIIFAIKIPLVDESKYTIYQMLPLPIGHNDSNLYSYISPNYPYLMISSTKVYYSEMNDLSKCSPIDTLEYLCYRTQLTRTNEKPICETLLLLSTTAKIPHMCKTHTLATNLEIWHPIDNNQWLFVLTQTQQLTVTCEPSIVEDTNIESTGLLSISPGCKGYTQTQILETTTRIKQNRTHKIPEINIAIDECCLIKNLPATIETVKLQPIKIANIKLDELKYANHKLQQLDEILQNQLNQPITSHHMSFWSILWTILSSLLTVLIFYIFYANGVDA